MDEGEEKKGFYDKKHQINIALAAQMRLSNLLDKIAILDASYPIDSPEKQKCYLNFVKQFFISAVPYLSVEDTNKYKKEILDFNIKKKSNVEKGTQNFKYYFDNELDRRLNEILVELQIKLRGIFTKIIDDDSGDPYN